MVILLVIISVVLMIAISYAIQQRRRARAPAESREPVSLWEIARDVPAGMFLQPSFTWTRILDSGEVAIGVQPVLLALTGEPDRVIAASVGTQVEKGDVLLTLCKGERRLHIRSPISGTVVAAQPEIESDDNRWRELNRRWLFILKPEHISEEIPTWFIGEEAMAWTEERYRRLREYFTSLLPQTSLGFTLADGGDIPVGVLSYFEQETWVEFEENFLK